MSAGNFGAEGYVVSDEEPYVVHVSPAAQQQPEAPTAANSQGAVTMRQLKVVSSGCSGSGKLAKRLSARGS